MTGFIVSLAALSIMFALITCAAILFRKHFLKDREGLMYPLWIFILVISVVPFHFNITGISATSPDLPEHENHETVSTDAGQTAGSSVIVSFDKKMSFRARAGRALADLASRAETLSTVMFIIWLTGASTRFAVTLLEC